MKNINFSNMIAGKKPDLPPNMELVNDMTKEELKSEYELISRKKSRLSALQRDLVIFRYQFEELGMYK